MKPGNGKYCSLSVQEDSAQCTLDRSVTETNTVTLSDSVSLSFGVSTSDQFSDSVTSGKENGKTLSVSVSSFSAPCLWCCHSYLRMIAQSECTVFCEWKHLCATMNVLLREFMSTQWTLARNRKCKHCAKANNPKLFELATLFELS